MSLMASEIASFLGKDLFGSDIQVVKPCSANRVCHNGLIFLTYYNEEYYNLAKEITECLAIVRQEYAGKLKCSYIISDKPRLDFSRAVQEFFVINKSSKGVADSAKIGRNVQLGKDVVMGEYCVVGDNVSIGARTELCHHVVINEGTEVGSDCFIKSHTVIGEKGFGFERDQQGVPFPMPHLGRVIIGNNVELGALNTVVRAALDSTVIGNNVKTDDHVHIGHNVVIGDNCLITACAEISGSVHIGQGSWLGPNCSIMDGIDIGEGCYIGLGAVVIKSLPPNVVVAGSPARILRGKNN